MREHTQSILRDILVCEYAITEEDSMQIVKKITETIEAEIEKLNKKGE